jgi:ribosome-associated translation inhibitor RaiA
MNYQITSDDMEITPSMEALAKEKFQRIEHRTKDVSDDARSARIVMKTAPEGMFTVKAMVVIDGKEYFSDETDYTLESALIKTVEEILEMMDKERNIDLRKRDEQDKKDAFLEGLDQ